MRKMLLRFVLLSVAFFPTSAVSAATGFQGFYDYSTWTSSETYGGATVSSVDATNQILTLMEPNTYPSTPWASQEFGFAHALITGGTVSFDWTFDASVDPCCSGLNFYLNDVLFANLAGGYFGDPYKFEGNLLSGSFSTAVNAGDVIKFGAFSADSCCGPTTSTISNFDAPSAVPEPGSWAMMLGGFGMVGGALRYRRRKPRGSFATA